MTIKGTLAFSIAVAVLAAAGSATNGAPAAQEGTSGRRVILLSVDGGADWIIDRFLEEGRAPALAGMASAGAAADALVSTMPSLTAPAHATLWTGTWTRWHGITANRIAELPRGEHTTLAWRNGFDSRALTAEPIWRTAARAGRRVLVLQATGGFPFVDDFGDLLLQFDVYFNRLLPETEIGGRLENGRQSFKVGETTFTVSKGRRDGELTLESGARRVNLVAGREGSFSDPLPVRVRDADARVRLRLYHYNENDGSFRLLQGSVQQVAASNPAKLEPFARLAGAVVGEEIVDDYHIGRFGPTLATGGTGDAEWWLADYLSANQEYFKGAVEFAAGEPWDLLILYVSNFDAAAHALVGMLDPASTTYEPARAERVWPLLHQAYVNYVDTFIADLRRRWPDAALVVTSDHGMEGAGRYLQPNVALRKAGLLTLTPGGEIALGRTQALYQSPKGPMIFINSTDWKGGVVPATDRAAVKAHVTRTLLDIRDPETRNPVVRAIFDPEIDGTALGIGGERGGDLYFDLQAGYYLLGGMTSEHEIVTGPPTGQGFHALAPWRRGLQGIFYAVGPGIPAGSRLGTIQAIDVAPTVARLLGIPAPAQSIGRSLLSN
jgi:predicted AlkP superfamily phosphohydrolase/phosphomutase